MISVHVVIDNIRLLTLLISKVMIIIIFIHKKYTLQIMATNKQHSPDLRMPVESYIKHICLIINLKAIIILILQK